MSIFIANLFFVSCSYVSQEWPMKLEKKEKSYDEQQKSPVH